MATMQPMTPLRPLVQASMKPPSPLHALEQQPLKPPSPLLAPKQRPLKPPSPLQPKTTPKTPISQPQRRQRFQLGLGLREQRRWWFQPHAQTSEQRRQRFQLGLGLREQRRWWFQPHTGTSAQRRWRFQTTGPPGRQSQAAVPVGGGWASPQHPWAISVTNVVKPEQFEPPCECSCYKRRQSASKNLDSQRKSPRIDDVCNNTQRSAPKSQHDKPDHIGGPENPAAVPVGGGGAWPGFEPTHPATHQRPRPTGVEGTGGAGGHGRAAKRGAWPRCRWAVAGPGRASRSTTPSRRLACGDLAGGPPPTGTHSGPAPQVWRAPEGPEGTGGLRGAAPNEVRP